MSATSTDALRAKRFISRPDWWGSASSSSRRTAAIVAGITVAYAAMVFWRRPDLFTDPKFFAEDGQAWFADAYNQSTLAPLLTPVAGYYQLFQRFVALVFTPLGLRSAALAFASVSVAVQLLPALMFASRRFRDTVSSDVVRVGLGALYLILTPPDLVGNLTAAQWHLALLALLVLLAAPARTRLGRAFDGCVLLTSGLTGPYALVMLPIAAWLQWRHRERRRHQQLAILAVATLVQIVALIATLHGAHRTQSLGASATGFVTIVANQMLVPFSSVAFGRSAVLESALVTCAVVALLVAGALRGPGALRVLMVFAAGIAAAGMTSPYSRIGDGETAWNVLAGGGGDRYFFLLSIALVMSLIVLTSRASLRRYRQVSVATLVAAAVTWAAAAHGQIAAPPHQDLDRYQLIVDHSPPGTLITIPIYPPGWQMQVRAR